MAPFHVKPQVLLITSFTQNGLRRHGAKLAEARFVPFKGRFELVRSKICSLRPWRVVPTRPGCRQPS